MATLIPILALRQRKVDLVKSASAIMAAANEDARDLTAAETKSFDKVQAALKDCEQKIVAAERDLALEADLPMSSDENSAFSSLARGENPGEQLPSVQQRRKASVAQVGIRSYAELFGPARSSGGFNSFEGFLKAVRSSNQLFDPRLQASMTGDVPSQSGFLVPDQFAAFVLNYALENAICMSRCQVWPMTSGALKVPGVKDTDHSAGALYGGIKEFWYGELATLDEENLATLLITLSARKLGMLANASSELIEDAASFESVLVANLQAAAQFFIDRACFFGSGANKPLGMLNPLNPSLVVVTKNASTPAGGILYEDVTQMFLAMAPACRQRATWVFTDELIPALLEMQLVVKNIAGSENVGGSATPMFTMNADGSGTLLGRPAIFTEKLKTAGAQGDAAFICFDQYAIGMRRELQLRRSNEAGFKQDSIWWRLTCRLDGQPTWANTLKLSNGNIVSPFVTLAVRS